MAIADERHLQLESILKDLRHAKTPIDDPRIERALIALIETVSDPGADAHAPARSTGFHGA